MYININDMDFFILMKRVCRYIDAWEMTNCPKRIREGLQILEAAREASKK